MSGLYKIDIKIDDVKSALFHEIGDINDDLAQKILDKLDLEEIEIESAKGFNDGMDGILLESYANICSQYDELKEKYNLIPSSSLKKSKKKRNKKNKNKLGI